MALSVLSLRTDPGIEIRTTQTLYILLDSGIRLTWRSQQSEPFGLASVHGQEPPPPPKTVIMHFIEREWESSTRPRRQHIKFQALDYVHKKVSFKLAHTVAVRLLPQTCK